MSNKLLPYHIFISVYLNIMSDIFQMEDQPEIRMQKYYLKHEILDLDEDLTHEFKGIY